MAMFSTIRKDTASVNTCIDNFRRKYWRDDPDVQRLYGAWAKQMKDKLILTACNKGYIPPILLAEEPTSPKTCEVWLIDGLHRISTLLAFYLDEYKISKNFEGIVEYTVDEKDEEGRLIFDENNRKISHVAECKLAGKYFSTLPKEVQDMFTSCSIDLVFHQECTREGISELVAMYNNHKAMNANQVAFTNIPKYARRIRDIATDNNCIQDYIMPNLPKSAQTSGLLERLVVEMCALLTHTETIATDFKVWCKNFNELDDGNASLIYLEEVLEDLETFFDNYPQVAKLYTSKNGSINVKVFDYHRSLKVDDKYFAEFMMSFDWNNFEAEVNQTNANRTKSVSKFHKKIDILEKAYIEYLKVNNPDFNDENNKVTTELDNEFTEPTSEEKLEFIHSNVEPNCNMEDVECFEESLEDLILNVDNSSKLLDKRNHLSLLGIVAYSYAHDEDLDDWIVDYFRRVTEFDLDSVNNYERMLIDFKGYIKRKGVA